MRVGKGGAGLYNANGFVRNKCRIQSSTGNVAGWDTSRRWRSNLDVAGDINLSGIVRFQGFPMLQRTGMGSTATGIGALA